MITTLELNTEDAKANQQIRDVALQIQKSRKVVAVTGAGISCNAGIPDFRSNDGLYNMVKEKHPNAVVKGKDLFDTVLFSNPTSIRVFFAFMSSLRKCIQKAHPTDTHRFISRLKSKGKLLRCYTQNIDGLEEKASPQDRVLSVGVNPKQKPDVVQLHGDLDKLKCMTCAYKCDWDEKQTQLCDDGEAPLCPLCFANQQERIQAGKRDTGVGSLRPDIVLYGEEHPDGDMIGKCHASDLKSRPDCLVIMGTSLKVVGIRKLVRTIAKAVKERGGIVVFVNASDTQSMWNNVIDYHIKGNCDDWVKKLKQDIPNFFADQQMLDFKVAKKGQVPSPPSTPTKAKLEVYTCSAQTQMPLTPVSRENSSAESDRERSPLKNITNTKKTRKRKAPSSSSSSTEIAQEKQQQPRRKRLRSSN